LFTIKEFTPQPQPQSHAHAHANTRHQDSRHRDRPDQTRPAPIHTHITDGSLSTHSHTHTHTGADKHFNQPTVSTQPPCPAHKRSISQPTNQTRHPMRYSPACLPACRCCYGSVASHASIPRSYLAAVRAVWGQKKAPAPRHADAYALKEKGGDPYTHTHIQAGQEWGKGERPACLCGCVWLGVPYIDGGRDRHDGRNVHASIHPSMSHSYTYVLTHSLTRSSSLKCSSGRQVLCYAIPSLIRESSGPSIK